MDADIINNLEAIIASQHQTIGHLMDLYNAIPEADDDEDQQLTEDLLGQLKVSREANAKLADDLARMTMLKDAAKRLICQRDERIATLVSDASLREQFIMDNTSGDGLDVANVRTGHHDGASFASARVGDLVISRMVDGSTDKQWGAFPVIVRKPEFNYDRTEARVTAWMPEGGFKTFTITDSDVQVWRDFKAAS